MSYMSYLPIGDSNLVETRIPQHLGCPSPGRALHWLAQALAEPEQEATQQEPSGPGCGPTAALRRQPLRFGLPGDVGLSAAECCAEESAELPRLGSSDGVQIE